MNAEEERALSAELLEVVHYRKAARSVVRDLTRSVDERGRALVFLAQRARDEAKMADWCREAIWEESRSFLLTGEPGYPPTSSAVTARLHVLRRSGRAACPNCLRPLPDDAALERLARMELDALEEIIRREGAV